MKSAACERFKTIRLYFKESQSSFADKLNIKQGHVSAIEIGHNNVSISIMQSLVNVYSIDLNWLITGKGKMINNTDSEINFDDIIIRLEEYKKHFQDK